MGREESDTMALRCASCGNERNFLVKTLQMHVMQVEDMHVGVSEESQPTVLEVLCDDCEMGLDFSELEDSLRQEMLSRLGAR